MQVLRLDDAVLILVVGHLSKAFGVQGYEAGFRLNEQQKRDKSLNTNLSHIEYKSDVEVIIFKLAIT